MKAPYRAAGQRLGVAQVRDAANGRWHNILTSMGMDTARLVNRHGPCPFCGGIDRWRWDDKDGSGSGICSQCGSGDGFTLAGKQLGLDPKTDDFKKILDAVAATLGIPSSTPMATTTTRATTRATTPRNQPATPTDAAPPREEIPLSAYEDNLGTAPPDEQLSPGRKPHPLIMGSTDALPDYPYFVDRMIQPHGLLQFHGRLTIGGMDCNGSAVIPLVNAGTGEHQTNQYISPTGEKRFPKGYPKKGGCHVIGGDLNGLGELFAIGEGFATAASIYEAMNFPAVMAIDSGNILLVAEALRKLHPNATIIIAGDDDTHLPNNPGRTKATGAAKAIGGIAVFPKFTQLELTPPHDAQPNWRPPTDFSDLRQLRGPGEVSRQITQAINAALSAAPPVVVVETAEAGFDDGRTVMKLAGGGLHWQVENSQRILFEQNPENVFERTSGLVRLVRQNTKSLEKGIARPKGSLSIVQVTEPWLQKELTGTIKYLKFDKRSGAWYPTDAPPLIGKVIIANEGDRPFHRLTGVITAPTMRADGSILDQHGYDFNTGLMFDPGGEIFPTILTNPTRDQAFKALELLMDVVSGFPFVSPSDRSVALAAILTALIRPTLRTAPMFAFTAPKMASGKTLLADAIALIATGKVPTTMTHEVDPAAEVKRLLAILLNGDQIACVDNISTAFQSDALCTILTQTTWSERLLGLNRTAEVSTNCLWLATGNNLVFRGDLSTRVLLCSLDPRVERPEERPFDRNLHEWIPANRGLLVAAGLTVLRAFHVTGRPKSANMKQFGRFEQWSDTVRACLVWLAQADPCQTREKIESSDPVRESLRSLLTAWFDVFGERPVTLAHASDIAKQLATQSKNHYPQDDQVESNPQLFNAMLAVAGDHNEVKTLKLSQYFSKHTGRIENNLSLQKGPPDRTKTTTWFVKIAGVQEYAGVVRNSPWKSGRENLFCDGVEKDNLENDSFKLAAGENPCTLLHSCTPANNVVLFPGPPKPVKSSDTTPFGRESGLI